MGERIGRYTVTRVLGRGGMGVVYAAHDDRLDREVAIKVIRPDVLGDDTARRRFTAEARAAARVSHPHICPLYEFDEHQGQPFLVMELLAGEPLGVRLARGSIPVREALALADAMLDALAALHRSGVVHRDLKPANIFLTPHGVKLLDFGLAQPLAVDDQTREARLTESGTLVGTPAYMAPEQLFEGRADERADVFAAAAVIYEMLGGRPAFSGATLAALMHAVAYAEPPALSGSDELVRIDRVLRHALTKPPAARIARADLLAGMLRETIASPSTDLTLSMVPSPCTRFVALPFRVLRPDAETDFLAFSIPDAISVSLAAIQSVTVRSTRGYEADADVRTIGRDLAVDVVLTGTLLRAGQNVRVSAQLADATAGTILWSDMAQAPIADLFQLQDALTTHIVSSLALPLTARDRRSLHRQAPASAEAYELYLRANTLMNDPARVGEARELYTKAVAIDPAYAPAWARLGRALRMLAKWGDAGAHLLMEAEAAFRRAYEIDPDSPIAHDLAAYVDAELGRAVDAIERLLLRARRRGLDPGLLSGLVTTCRYAGLLEASRAAHERAIAMDAAQSTSVAWTHLLLGDYPAAIRADHGTPAFAAILSRVLLGEVDAERLRQFEAETSARGARLAVAAYRAVFEGSVEEGLRHLESLRVAGFNDPEGWYIYAFCLARWGEAAHAVRLLTLAVNGGYAPHIPLTRAPEWQAIAGEPGFAALVDRTATMVARAQDRFGAAGGRSVLMVHMRTDDEGASRK